MGWFKNLKTQSKLLTLFSLITLLGAITTGWTIYTIVQFNQEVKEVVQEALELAEVEEVQVYLLEQQIAINDFRFTGEERFLVQYEEAEELADLYLRRALIDANSTDQRDALGLLSEEIEEYNRTFDEVVELHEQGEYEAALELAAEVDAIEAERVERMHDQIERFVYKGELELKEDLLEADTRTKKSIAVGVVSLVLFSGLAIVASIVTNQVAEPILHMTNAVVAFENDAYEPELLEAYVKRREELGQLARAFNNMVNSITASAQAKDQLLSASSRFVPVAYLDFLEKNSITEINLGDHVSAEMAVMFSDIRSFTTISEGMTPQENFDFINTYLKRVSPAIQEHSGFIVKFLGDGMMAVFPYEVEDALKAGIQKIKVVNQYNAERQAQGLHPIDLGIGIHTGHMMVGMIGEETRLQGDAFSDNVNLTARIEGLSKFFGISLIISAETLARLEEPGKYNTRPLGAVIVKGREKPIRLYEIFDADPEGRKELKLSTQADYTEGLRLYTLGNFSAAQPLFASVLERHPEDKTASLYLSLTQQYLAEGRPNDWDGVIMMTTK